ncbi:hypothetical protein [Aeromonas veronii]|uniref:hypothetical protein n=1 Tax=Aeromonas veronii TaxID=654 RepID=UPI00226C7DA7|nr:hypothetical protein [Aeromonas veronii]MCX9104030.1 hypothetical protein [Aeromonas veronii]MCX9119681.1 hypothetical protein [Aeromonas veronii]
MSKQRILLFCGMVFMLSACYSGKQDEATPHESEAIAAEKSMPAFESNGIKGHDEEKSLAIKYLVEACPPVSASSVVGITASYAEGIDTYWRGTDLGWQREVYFNVDDSKVSGHHHHFYVRLDGKPTVMINGKQASMDFCGIPLKMKNYHLIYPSSN